MLVVEHRSLLAEGVVATIRSALGARVRVAATGDWTSARSDGTPAFAVVGEVAGDRQRRVVRGLVAAGTFVIALGPDAESVSTLLADGATSHVSAAEGLDEIARAAVDALSSLRYLSPASTAALGRAGATRVRVSAREAEVLRLFVADEALSIKEIAVLLSLSPQTVRSHLTRVRARYRSVGLDAGSRQALRHVVAREDRQRE